MNRKQGKRSDRPEDELPPKPPPKPPEFYSSWGEPLDSYTMSPEQQREVQRYWEQVNAYEAARDSVDFWDLAAEVKEKHGELPDTDDPMAGSAWHKEIAWRRRLKKEEEALSDDPDAWIRADRMTQTEASLRVAFHLLDGNHAASDITLTLTGSELTTLKKPKFPVGLYLEQRGYTPTLLHIDRDWRTRYAKGVGQHGLALSTQRGMWDVMTTTVTGQRLLMLTTGSALKAYKGSWEHGVLRHLLGRALARPDVQPDDQVAVTVPRTERNRKLIAEVRASPLVVRSGIRICTIDRGGDLTGMWSKGQ